MTFCVAMKVEEGLVGIADTRVTSGVEYITARKVSIHRHGRHSLFLMASGLRSARDKALTYFEEVLDANGEDFDKLYKAVNALAEQVRRVAAEDKTALAESGLFFNLFSIVGGRLANDREHKLYMLYPQGNWVEVGRGTPYYLIGESSYGKPLLDRALSYESSMRTALKLGYLAFDATRTAATDVDFPLDIVLYRAGSFEMTCHRYERAELWPISEWWQEQLTHLVEEMPQEWIDRALALLPEPAEDQP